jgi:hypothetical protein
MLGVLLLLGDGSVAGEEGDCDEGEADVRVVFDQGLGVGWLEGALVGQFREMGLDHPEGIHLIRSSREASHVLPPKVVETYSQAIVALSNGLHLSNQLYHNLTYQLT